MNFLKQCPLTLLTLNQHLHINIGKKGLQQTFLAHNTILEEKSFLSTYRKKYMSYKNELLYQ